MAIQENGRSNQVDGATLWAFRALKPGDNVVYTGRADYLSMAVQNHLQSALDGMNGHHNSRMKAEVKPFQTDDSQYELDVRVTHVSHSEAEIYQQKVQILPDPNNRDKLIGILNANNPDTEIGLMIDGVLQDPHKSVEFDFQSRLEPTIKVQEVATEISRGNLYVYVKGKPIFSTNGHH